jgi:hypothetical protein
MKIFKIVILILLACVLCAVGFGYYFLRSEKLQNVAMNQVSKIITKDSTKQDLLHNALGYVKPQTYLVIFLNNTEIRPGGGFIGSYAVIKMDKGAPSILKIEGTEILDNVGKKDFKSDPPEPIKKFLKVDRWFFRDSNWSPDFTVSALKGIELYVKQGGGFGEQIDSVVAFTPTLIEEILKVHGPVKVGNEEFTAENFTEKLEYEVEYGFADKGIKFSDRKSMLKNLAHVMIADIKYDIFLNWSKFLGIAERMIEEKQVVFFSNNQELQSIARSYGWSGEMKETKSDYLMWVDANLGALKTDFSIKRNLTYTIRQENNRYIAEAKMKFKHNGKFDWRTTRYRDYARVFVPIGSEFVSNTGAMETDKSVKKGKVDTGVENGKQWFGAFISIEPGKESEMSFKYYLPSGIAEQIESGEYVLFAQKQIGMVNYELTLDLDFGKKIKRATPGEDAKFFGDNKYYVSELLKGNSEFVVKF